MTPCKNPIKRSLVAVLALIVPMTASVSANDEAAPSRVFEALDVFELEYADDPELSPDGEHIVYVRTSMDVMTDKARKNLWLVDVDGDNHRPLFSGRDSYSNPVWSPDGDRLAYLSNAEGSNQLYVHWMDSNQSALVSNLQKSPKHITWSPDGKWLAFLMFVPKPSTPLATMPSKPKGAEWSEGVRQIDSLIYRADGRGFLEEGTDQLFVIPAEGGSPRQLTTGDFDHSGPLAWSSDGERIFLSSHRVEDWEYDVQESDLYAVDVASGAIEQLTDRKGPDGSPALSPDGRLLAYLGHDIRYTGYNNDQLWLMDLESGDKRLLSGDFDRSVGDIQWAEDGKSIWFQYTDFGTERLGYVDLRGRLTETPLRLGGTTLGRPYSSGTYDVGPSGTVVYTASASERPADLAVSRDGKRATQITALNEDVLGHKTLAPVEHLTWASSHDGLEIEGWLMTPPGFDPEQRYPMILEIHGGPHTAYGPNFSAEAQLYAAAGYVVLYTNPRGSTGYGDDFANAIHLAYPGYDYDDLMSGVDAVLERGFVDPEQLFVTGGSGGGVLTAWIVGKTDRFRAAVVAKPVINWISFALTADFAPYFSKFWFDGPAWEKTEDYWRRSPLSLVGNVTTPTMLLTGEADYRTPMSETEQYYQALKQRKVDTMMIRVPGSPHGIAGKPSRLVAKVNNILAWFERYRPQQQD